MNSDMSLDKSAEQKSWPAGFDDRIDEDLELCSLFKDEPEMSKPMKVLKEQQLEKGLKGKRRAWQYTLNEITKWDNFKKNLLEYKSLNYAIATMEEAPSTGHLHIHCYAQFKTPVKVPISKLEGAHAEQAKASPELNLDYIYKRGKWADGKHGKPGKIIFEYGELRGMGHKIETIRDLKNASNEDLEDMPIEQYNTYKQELIRRANIIKLKEWSSPKTIYYIHGESGMGKTELAKFICEKKGIEDLEICKCDKNGFYHGLAGETKTICYDDFRDSHMTPSEFINLIDYNSHTMNIKYGSLVNKYETIFITSVQSPQGLWEGMQEKKGEEAAIQWLRRINFCIYVGPDAKLVFQNPKTGETLKEVISLEFKKRLDELKKKKEAEEKEKSIENLINLIS